jgi:hypothetical protein
MSFRITLGLWAVALVIFFFFFFGPGLVLWGLTGSYAIILCMIEPCRVRSDSETRGKEILSADVPENARR